MQHSAEKQLKMKLQNGEILKSPPKRSKIFEPFESRPKNERDGVKKQGLLMVCSVCKKDIAFSEYKDHVKVCLYIQNSWKGGEVGEELKEKKEGNNLRQGIQEQQMVFKQFPEKQKWGKQEQELDNLSRIYLQKFEREKSNISRVYERRSGLREKEKQKKQKEQEEFSELPCPFCAKILTLDELDHIDNCERATLCRYCKDKYPTSLFGGHLVVCKSRPRIPFDKKGGFKKQKQIKKEQVRPVDHEKNRVNEHKHQNIHNRNAASQKFNGLSHIKRAQGHIGLEYQNYVPNQEELEQQSKIRKKNQKGLTQQEINSLDLDIFIPRRAEATEEQDCSICSIKFEAEQSIVVLRCRHLFHGDCLLPWMREHSTCPTCKERMVK